MPAGVSSVWPLQVVSVIASNANVYSFNPVLLLFPCKEKQMKVGAFFAFCLALFLFVFGCDQKSEKTVPPPTDGNPVVSAPVDSKPVQVAKFEVKIEYCTS